MAERAPPLALPMGKPPPPYRVEGERLYLRDVRLADVGPAYLRWMNDPDVNQYLESRFARHTPESLAAFVRANNASPTEAFFAIVLTDGDRHIGNIKIGTIHWTHRFGDMGLLLGERDTWGQGYATEAIRLATRFGFETLRLHKLTAGCYAPNVASERAFLKAGWRREGVRKEYFRSGEGWVDGILLGITEAQWRAARPA